MQFQSIIGQKDTKEHLVQMVQQNRLSHALLFLGKEGSGALSLAMAFAHVPTMSALATSTAGRVPSMLKAEAYSLSNSAPTEALLIVAST